MQAVNLVPGLLLSCLPHNFQSGQWSDVSATPPRGQLSSSLPWHVAARLGSRSLRLGQPTSPVWSRHHGRERIEPLAASIGACRRHCQSPWTVSRGLDRRTDGRVEHRLVAAAVFDACYISSPSTFVDNSLFNLASQRPSKDITLPLSPPIHPLSSSNTLTTTPQPPSTPHPFIPPQGATPSQPHPNHHLPLNTFQTKQQTPNQRKAKREKKMLYSHQNQDTSDSASHPPAQVDPTGFGKVALVTGCVSGIGLATTQSLLAHQFCVCGLDLEGLTIVCCFLLVFSRLASCQLCCC